MSNGKHRTGPAAWPVSHDKAGMSVDERVKDHMLTLLKRHHAQTVLAAGHDQIEIVDLAGVSVRSVLRSAAELAVEHVDDR